PPSSRLPPYTTLFRSLPERFQPFAELAGEALVVQRQPAFVDDEQRRAAVEPVADSVEEIGEHGGGRPGSDKSLDLKRLHGGAARSAEHTFELPSREEL